jgi:hypothetical protein
MGHLQDMSAKQRIAFIAEGYQRKKDANKVIILYYNEEKWEEL